MLVFMAIYISWENLSITDRKMFFAMALLILLYFLPYRVKTKQRKAVVTTVDKKIPNGILEEQGNIVIKWTY